MLGDDCLLDALVVANDVAVDNDLAVNVDAGTCEQR